MTKYASLSRFLRREMSRRTVIHTTIGTAGVVLGSEFLTPARADDDNASRCAVPLPQTHVTAGPFGPLHFYFPGPIDGSAAATDATGVHPEGRDPSTITNFSGFVGQVDLTFSGTARDTKTGATANYSFHTVTRLIKGDFIASD